MNAQSGALVSARGATVTFMSGGLLARRPPVRAVTDVDIEIGPSEAVGLVGESGSGKSTLGRLLLGLLKPTAGEVNFEGRRLDQVSRRDWRALRARMQIIFQDPYGSLDPRRRVGAQIADGLAIHGLASVAALDTEVVRRLSVVGLDPSHATRYPHEFSGGQRQRIGIARALATDPAFLVADEPVSSLDVSIQAQIMELLARVRQERKLALLFISHDLPVVRQISDRVLIMYLGRIVEAGPAATVLARPAHPYTRALVSATPRLTGKGRKRIILAGDPPSPTAPPSGCAFRTRCAHAVDACADGVPPMQKLGLDHTAACIRLSEIN
jgi:oligopeptide/dipeptide ABC transporter ATP-binding protein